MNWKTIIVCYINLHLLLALIGFISPDKNYVTILGFLGCFYFSSIYTKLFISCKSPFKVLLILISIRLLLLGGYDLYLSISETVSMPFLVIHLLGIGTGFIYIYSKSKLKLLPYLISSIFVLFMVFGGWTYWIHFHNFGTFTGLVKAYNLPVKFEAVDEQNNLVSNANFQNKIVLLDFWTTSCGICFQKFPKLQNTFNQYKSDSSVMILAVNSPIEEDKPNQAFEMIQERKYSFPVVITKDKLLAEKYGVTGFPTTFVINQNGLVVYRGDIEGAIKMVNASKSNVP